MRPAIILDVSRTLSPKSIASPTGVDRVERAYIAHFLDSDREVWFLSRLGSKSALVDKVGMAALMTRVNGEEPWGARDVRGLLKGIQGQIEADIRRFAVDVGGLEDIAVQAGDGFTYLNVGHTNMSAEAFSDLRIAGAGRFIGLIHDMIPLDHPELQTPKSVVRFSERIHALSQNADVIIANSNHTAERVKHWFKEWGGPAQIITSHLGVSAPLEVLAHTSDRPYFVQLGTIEPRKNHALTLKIWEAFQALEPDARPILHIIGRRGWLNEEVFETLDTASFMGRDVFVHEDLNDAQVASFLKGAHGLLFPSLAEGYGFPLLEAAQLGMPVVASDLPVFKEFGDTGTLYIDPLSAKDWEKAVKQLASKKNRASNSQRIVKKSVPKWDEHFARLDSFL